MPAALAGDAVAHDAARLANAANLPAETLHELFGWAADGGPADYARDKGDAQAAHAELQRLWGNEYEGNLAAVRRYVRNNVPPEVGAALMNASFKDGRAVANDPAVLIRLAALANRSPVMPDPTGDIDKDIKAIEHAMRHDNERYLADAGLQARAMSLYAARAARKEQAAGAMNGQGAIDGQLVKVGNATTYITRRSPEAELAALRKQMGTDAWAKNAAGQARFMELTARKRGS